MTSAPPDNLNLTVSALKFSHPKGTPIYYTNWDKYSLEYRTSSSGGWNVYAGMPLAINYDSQATEYRDVLATSTYEWRYRYYSTEKLAYSDYSDTIGATGWARNTVGYMLKEVRKVVNDPDGKTISDVEIIRFFNAAQDKIYTLYDRWWFLLKIGTVIPTVVGQKAYAMPTDFGRMHSVLFENVQGSSDITYNLEYKSMIEYDDISRNNNSSNDDGMKFYSIFPPDTSSSTGYLRVWPKPATVSLNITPRYFKMFTDLSDYADVTEVPIPDILENYAIGMILLIRKEEDKANVYLGSPSRPGQFYQQIELLKLMQRKNARPMRSLWEYRGRDAEKYLFGNRSASSQDRENFW